MNILHQKYWFSNVLVEPLTLSTPTHKPRSVSAYGRRRGSVAGSNSIHDFKSVKNDGTRANWYIN